MLSLTPYEAFCIAFLSSNEVAYSGALHSLDTDRLARVAMPVWRAGNGLPGPDVQDIAEAYEEAGLPAGERLDGDTDFLAGRLKRAARAAAVEYQARGAM